MHIALCICIMYKTGNGKRTGRGGKREGNGRANGSERVSEEGYILHYAYAYYIKREKGRAREGEEIGMQGKGIWKEGKGWEGHMEAKGRENGRRGEGKEKVKRKERDGKGKGMHMHIYYAYFKK